MTTSRTEPLGRRVRVWYEDHVIAEYRGEARQADRYAAAMSRHIDGLRVTCEPLSTDDSATCRPLPRERLWNAGR